MSHPEKLNTYIQEASETTMELIAEQVELFNEASGYALTLENSAVQGAFTRQGVLKGVGKNRYSIDMDSPNKQVSATMLEYGALKEVHLKGGDTMLLEPELLTLLRVDPKAAIDQIAQETSRSIMEHMLHDAIQAAVTCVKVGGAKEAITGVVNQRAINKSFRKFGASASQLKTTFMSGLAANDLQDSMLANAENLYSHGDVTVLSVLGKKVVVVDAPALTDGDKDIILTLTSGAVTVKQGETQSRHYDVNGYERFIDELKTNYDYSVGVKGYAWADRDGVPRVSEQLKIQANFKKVYDDIKNTAGVILEVTPSA